MRKIRIAVIGCGSIGLRHLRNLLRNDQVEAAAMDADLNSVRYVRAMDSSIRIFSSFRELEAWKTDIVIVATPNHLHKEHALRAFGSGAHVLCEKPIACSVADAKIMEAAAEKAGKILAVGLTERFRSAVDHLIRESVSGSLGTIVGGRAMVGTYNTLLCAHDPSHRANEFGAIVIDYVHELDILNAVFGSPSNIECFCNSSGSKPLKASPSLIAAIMKYPEEAVVSIHFDYIQHPQRRLLEIYGDRKTLEYNFQTDILTTYDCEKNEPESRNFQNVRDDQFVREHNNMIDAVLRGIPPKIPVSEAIKSLLVAERILEKLKAAGQDGKN